MAWNGGDLEKLVLQNRVGRLALGAAKWTAAEALRGDLGWSLFSERMVKAVLNYKWVLRRSTQLCELQRICYATLPGAERSSAVEFSLEHSRNAEIQKCCSYLSAKAKDQHIRPDVTYYAVYAVVRVKEINTKLHPMFSGQLLSCIGSIWGYRQLQSEVEALSKVKCSTAPVLPAGTQQVEDKLRKLWKALKPDATLQNIVSKQWQEIGFQGDDPCTDFRGMGLLSLENLLYFAETHESAARHVLSRSCHPIYGYVIPLQYEYVFPVQYRYMLPLQYEYVLPLQHDYVFPVQYRYMLPLQYEYVLPLQHDYVFPVQYRYMLLLQYGCVLPQQHDYVFPVQYRYMLPLQYGYVLPLQHDYVFPVQYRYMLLLQYGCVLPLQHDYVFPVQYRYMLPLQYEYVLPVQHDYVFPVQHRYMLPLQYEYVLSVQYRYMLPLQYEYVLPVQYRYMLPLQYGYVFPLQYEYVLPVQYRYMLPLQYSFAIVGINLTHLVLTLLNDGSLKNHFYNIAVKEIKEATTAKKAGQAGLQLPSLRQFHQVYCYVFFEFDSLWRNEKPKDIMEFNRIRDMFEEAVRVRLQKQDCILKANFVLENV
ncbi:ELMO domain [Trinorchestia longiramus]|nr:ELMO domain [Trinorchestia longiramus]